MALTPTACAGSGKKLAMAICCPDCGADTRSFEPHTRFCKHNQFRTQSWAVTVERNGEQVVTIASNNLSGRNLSAEDERVIEIAARHLLSFIGKPAPGADQ